MGLFMPVDSPQSDTVLIRYDPDRDSCYDSLLYRIWLAMVANSTFKRHYRRFYDPDQPDQMSSPM